MQQGYLVFLTWKEVGRAQCHKPRSGFCCRLLVFLRLSTLPIVSSVVVVLSMSLLATVSTNEMEIPLRTCRQNVEQRLSRMSFFVERETVYIRSTVLEYFMPW